ncbi:ThiF family adenylyltransferase [Diaminobutyricibacter tongyongensis]|uniref:ThiF family adenylyltransferase n=1 Tax=Leifsonia tongyongensis TaxID=1268043 RepID=A0A6L9Y300_9MICO|nr:ThiF family adenylyltransferase [Diaminobutyricibacter tongyongensis]NEN07654.1 ThiF family adenylyltransferase [Diaminobutyricibacter tongyongensis]
MTGETEAAMRDHLIRSDGQEDVLIATYGPSTGLERTTALIRSVILPRDGERHVHGNASFTSAYVLRAASEARAAGHGLVLLHSHPGGEGWQRLSSMDRDTESEYERVARAATKMPLLGMTLGGQDTAWSARFWFDRTTPTWAESVRSVSPTLAVTWNDDLRAVPGVTASQERTVSSWGERAQGSISRLRVLVVGSGSVGLDIAQRLAATGLLNVGVMDYDAVETRNLDRMIGATRLDAALGRSKVDVAARLMKSAATAAHVEVRRHEVSITDPVGVSIALDYDVIFSCVDRPWPRAVLNGIAYADLIPVIDGGIALDTFADGRLRNGIWRAHTLVPGRPCMACIGQLVAGDVSLDKLGLLDDPEYIKGANREVPSSQNVAALSASVSSALLAQFVSLTAHPGRRGVPDPLRYILSTHMLEHSTATSGPYCPYENATTAGDRRTPIAEHREGWRTIVNNRTAKKHSLRLRAVAKLESVVQRVINRVVG